MSAGDCTYCGGDGHLPGSAGAARCPRCDGTGNTRRHRITSDIRFWFAILVIELAAIATIEAIALSRGVWLA